MNRIVTFLVVSLVAMTLLVSAGPALSELLRAAVPLVIAVGIVVAVLRLVFFHTRRW